MIGDPLDGPPTSALINTGERDRVAGWVRGRGRAPRRQPAARSADGVLSPTLIDGATPDMKVCELGCSAPPSR